MKRIGMGLAILAICAAVLFSLMPERTTELHASPEAAISESNGDHGQRAEPSPVKVGSVRSANRHAVDLEAASDYGLVLAQVLPAAEAGDAEAMNTVAKVLEYCMFFRSAPGNFDIHVQTLARISPDQSAALNEASAKVKSRCRAVHSDGPIAMETIDGWQNKAAGAGNLSALVRSASRDLQDVRPEDHADLLRAVLDSGDPALMLEASSLIARSAPDQSLGFEVGNDPINEYAWQIAACRLGAPCNRGQNLLDSYCLSGSGCTAGSLEELIRQKGLPQSAGLVLDKKIGAIVGSVNVAKKN